MKATVSCLAALLVALACSDAARAQQPCYAGQFAGSQTPIGCPPSPPPGPYGGMMGGAMMGGAMMGGGMMGGPNGGPNPPRPPFNGMLPYQSQSRMPMFRTHPYARSPRDFFMIDIR